MGVAERLRNDVENLEVVYEEETIKVTCSIGVAESVEDDKTVEDSLKRADIAMYQAKQAGRNQVKSFQL